MAVVRKIKIYDVWAGSGSPVASEYHGVTVETWGSKQVAVMTIAEGGNRLGADWDSGFSEKSDMRYYPRPVSGNGGTITLINSGRWFQDFESSGYDVRGCRVERTWTGNIATVPLSDHFVSDVKIGVNEISLSLGLIDTAVDSLVTGKYKGVQIPFVAGKNENVELVKVGGEEIPLFGGMTFRGSYNGGFGLINDTYGAPLEIVTYIVPTDSNFAKTAYNISGYNNLCRIVSGYGKDNVYRLVSISLAETEYQIRLENIFGVVTTDDFPTGIMTDYAQSPDMSKVSVFLFFTLDQSFLIGENTIIADLNDGTNPVALKTVVNGVLQIADQTGTPLVQKTEWDSNVTGFTGVSGSLRSGNVLQDNLTSFESTVTTLLPDNIKDKNRSTFVQATRPEREKDPNDGARSFIGLTYNTSKIPEDIKGISLFVKCKNSQPFSAFENSPYFSVMVYAHYEPANGWGGQSKVVTILDRDVELNKTIADGGGSLYIDNISGEYFQPSAVGLQNNPFDEIDRTSFSFGAKRGTEKFTFTGVDEFSKPTLITVSIVYYSGVIFDVTDPQLDLSIYELAIFGKESGKAGAIEKLIGTVESTAITTIGQVITHFAGKQDFGKFQTVTVPVYTNAKKARGYISDKDQLKTSVALAKALREAWAIGYVNRNKQYVVKDISGYVGKDIEVPASHRFYTPDGFELDSDAISYNYEELPTGGTITYGNGKTIVVTDADKTSYSTSYVVGVTDARRAKFLWDRCHAIYMKTGLLQDVRSDVAKLEWLYEESAALEYFENLLEWNGSPQYVILDNDLDFVRKIIEATFTVAAIDTSVSGVLWNIGDPCRVFIAGITDTEYSGIVTGIAYNAKEYSANVSVRVAELEQAPNTIIETGNPLDKTYIETGSTLIKTIKEVGVK